MTILAILLVLLGLFMGGCALTILSEGIVGNPLALLAAGVGLLGGGLTAVGYVVFHKGRRPRHPRSQIDHPDFKGLP